MDLQGQNHLDSTFDDTARSRGPLAWLMAIALTSFYLVLYFEDDLPFRPLTPLAQALGLDNRWYLYGFLYCVAMSVGAYGYLKKHGNSRYHQVRIAVNVLVQIILGFTLPFVMHLFGQRDIYFSYLWPLKIEYLYPHELSHYPAYFAAYSLIASLVAVPLLTLRFGKRWYCSWVCGCGGLANTFGDPFRHLTSKTERSHRIEKTTISVVFALAMFTTILVVIDDVLQGAWALHELSSWLRRSYGFVIGAVLSGVIGVGVYPLLGPRFWCRNFCPMAALLGVMQKAGSFVVRVKEDMCISCGNCTVYCEMGIDVRAYAQKNESFTRASCVGCGMCAHVCPRGVLKVESKKRRLAVLQ